MDSSLQRRRTILMTGLIALPGKDVVAAFIEGGFRVARRERGLALLVRGVQVVVVPETGLLTETRMRGLLERAEVAEDDLLTWLARANGPTRASSGFHRKTSSEPPGTVHAAVKNASDARARADVTHVATRNVLESSDAFQKTLAKWHDALQEIDETAKRELRTRKR
jgi:hypothetical protein